MLSRNNILDFLGNNGRKYHSCVICSYSFDFVFFEQVVLPKLRAAGINNVNVFVDAKMLEKALANFQGADYLKHKSTYSLIPVDCVGAFHPKFLLAVGKNKGLLSIGSGNLTGPGLSYNDEIWGSFHFKEENDKMGAIFKKASLFVNELKQFTFDVHLTKLKWLDNAQWYNKLSEENYADFETPDHSIDFKIGFQNSLFREVLTKFPKNPDSIKIISPYYNRNGDFLALLKKHFKPAQMHCMINVKTGNHPVRLKDEFIKFTDWNAQNTDNARLGNLHAKAYQFEYHDKTIFILGSANATIEAFGNEQNLGSNIEAILILDSPQKKDFFKELGVNFSVNNCIDVSKLEEQKNDETELRSSKIKLIQVNAYTNAAKLFFKEPQSGSYSAVFENADGEILLQKDIVVNEPIVLIKDLKIVGQDLFRCSIWQNEERISNYAFVQFPEKLLKTNPDERLSRFNELQNRDFFEDLEMELFLDFLQNEDIFYEESSTTNFSVSKKESRADIGIANVVTIDQFHKNDKLINENNSRTGTHLSSLIEDFLDALNFNAVREPDELSDNVEEAEIGNEDVGNSKDLSIQAKSIELTFQQGRRIERKLSSVIKDITGFIDKYITDAKPAYDIRPLNAILIGLNLLFKYFDKTYEQKQCDITLKYDCLSNLREIEKSYSLVRREHQLGNAKDEVTYYIDFNLLEDIIHKLKKPSVVEIANIDNENVMVTKHRYIGKNISPNQDLSIAQEFIYHTLPTYLQFLKISKNNDVSPEVEWTSKLVKMVATAFLLINKFSWLKHEKSVRDIIILNMMEVCNFNLISERVQAELRSKISISKQPLEYLDKANMFISKYLNFKKKVEDGTDDIKFDITSGLIDSIVYSNSSGFGILKHCYNDYFINLESPFGEYNLQTGIIGFHKIYVGKQLKIFS